MGYIFSLNAQPESILYKFRGFLNPRGEFFVAGRTLTNLKKTVTCKQLAALVLDQFKLFQALQHVPEGSLIHSRSLPSI